MKYPWSTSRSNSGLSGDTEAGDVPLENISRQSSSNTSTPSPTPDHGQRIIQEIQSGNYTCSICLDPVTAGTTYEYSLWHCRSCYTVTHFRCAKSWFEANQRNTAPALPSLFAPRRWKCPSCALECPEPKAKCWCQKHGFGTLDPLDGKPNACRETCDRVGACLHGGQNVCRKRCHPGRCEMPCERACADEPVVPRVPGRWKRFCRRFQQRKTGQVRGVLFLIVLLVIIYVLLGVFCWYHVKLWSQPYRYTDWREGEGRGLAEGVAAVVCGTVFFLPALAVLLFFIHRRVVNFIVLAFNIGPWDGKCTMRVLVGVVCLGIWILPIIGFAGGPNIAWYHQMKDTCNGLDTRIAMYKEGTFKVNSLSRNIPSYDMYLGSHLKPILEPGFGNNTNAIHTFESYQRLSISRPSNSSPAEMEHLAIDIDIPHHMYRVLQLNATDLENTYLAYGYKHKSSLTSVPTFHPLSETLISNGTFSLVSDKNKHMLLPELNMGIANMYGYIMDYEQEPFVKVYQNHSLSPPSSSSSSQDQAFNTTLAQPWDSKKKGNEEQEVVMRTASFGHGRQRLDVCVREQKDASRWKEPVGVDVELWAPFAVLAAYRQRMEEVKWGSGKERKVSCSD